MPESAKHARLVRAILDFIDRDFQSLTEIAIRDDASAPFRGERPPSVGGFVPDVYATDVPTTVTVIGEAKTRPDLETLHSQTQIAAFLAYLKLTPGGCVCTQCSNECRGNSAPYRYRHKPTGWLRLDAPRRTRWAYLNVRER